MITYAELLKKLQALTPEQLKQTATVSLDISEKAVAVNYAHETQKGDMLDGVLDTGHIVLGVNF